MNREMNEREAYARSNTPDTRTCFCKSAFVRQQMIISNPRTSANISENQNNAGVDVQIDISVPFAGFNHTNHCPIDKEANAIGRRSLKIKFVSLNLIVMYQQVKYAPHNGTRIYNHIFSNIKKLNSKPSILLKSYNILYAVLNESFDDYVHNLYSQCSASFGLQHFKKFNLTLHLNTEIQMGLSASR